MLVCEFRVSLLHVDPPVWRRVRMPADARLDLVHRALQQVMGWEDRHLHEFVAKGGRRYGEADRGEGDERLLDEGMHVLSELFGAPGDRALYCYDFGDDWVHELLLESLGELPPGGQPLRCLGGSGACPPEDCGGAPGYALLLGEPGGSVDPVPFDCAPFNERAEGVFPPEEEMRSPESASEGLDLLVGLRDLLEAGGAPEEAMSVMMLDGFFSALAIHPHSIMPDRWLPWVWDVTGSGREPSFSSKQEVEEAMGLLFTYYNSVVRQLGEESEEYAPLFDVLGVERGEELQLATRDWAQGFMIGVMIDEDVWERIFGDEEAMLLLSPFALMAGMVGEVEEFGEEEIEKIKESVPDDMAQGVLALREFLEPWRREYLLRHGGGGMVRTEAPAGRNDLCPCGSGKKYKKCCGR